MKEELKILFAEEFSQLFGRIRKMKRGYYFSQFGEDEYLLSRITEEKLDCNSYLDIGAAHPVIGSNTFIFYMNGGSGVTVDANPRLINQQKKIRPRDRQVHACVGKVDSIVDFDLNSNWSFSRRSEGPSASLGTKRIAVPQITINSLLKHFVNSKDWFLNVDVEGLEVEILESADFSISCPTYCLIEVTKLSFTKIEAIMKTWGFIPLQTLGMTRIFRKSPLL